MKYYFGACFLIALLGGLIASIAPHTDMNIVMTTMLLFSANLWLGITAILFRLDQLVEHKDRLAVPLHAELAVRSALDV